MIKVALFGFGHQGASLFINRNSKLTVFDVIKVALSFGFGHHGASLFCNRNSKFAVLAV